MLENIKENLKIFLFGLKTMFLFYASMLFICFFISFTIISGSGICYTYISTIIYPLSILLLFLLTIHTPMNKENKIYINHLLFAMFVFFSFYSLRYLISDLKHIGAVLTYVLLVIIYSSIITTNFIYSLISLSKNQNIGFLEVMENLTLRKESIKTHILSIILIFLNIIPLFIFFFIPKYVSIILTLIICFVIGIVAKKLIKEAKETYQKINSN
jgi:hypothetical protein